MYWSAAAGRETAATIATSKHCVAWVKLSSCCESDAVAEPHSRARLDLMGSMFSSKAMVPYLHPFLLLIVSVASAKGGSEILSGIADTPVRMLGRVASREDNRRQLVYAFSCAVTASAALLIICHGQPCGVAKGSVDRNGSQNRSPADFGRCGRQARRGKNNPLNKKALVNASRTCS